MTATDMKIGIGIGIIAILGALMVLIIRSKINSSNTAMAEATNIGHTSMFSDIMHRIGRVMSNMVETLIALVVGFGIFGGAIWLFISLVTSATPPNPSPAPKESKATEATQTHRLLKKEDPTVANKDIGKTNTALQSNDSQHMAKENISLASQGYYTNNTYHTYLKFNMNKRMLEMQAHNNLIYVHNIKPYLGRYGGIIIHGVQTNGKPISLLIMFNRNNNHIAINMQGDHTKVSRPRIIRNYSEPNASKLASSHLIEDPQMTFKYTPRA